MFSNCSFEAGTTGLTELGWQEFQDSEYLKPRFVFPRSSSESDWTKSGWCRVVALSGRLNLDRHQLVTLFRLRVIGYFGDIFGKSAVAVMAGSSQLGGKSGSCALEL